jgi:hypothetical protein
MNPRFPIYIVSKGRHETRLTSRALDAMGVPHFMIVEAQELLLYAAVNVPTCTLLVLDPEFQDTYDTCDDLGNTKSKGPGAARNFAWAHALQSGAAWHWVMDDNIRRWYRMNRNLKVPCSDGTPFYVMEEWCLRYANLGMAGPQYEFFAPRKVKFPPFIMNTRIYSCNLIRNSVPFRWRGRYNEDTDLSLRLLKAGWCTVQFNAFLQKKLPTQTVKGGCDADFYAVEGTKPKSEMQVRLHPDVSRLVFRYGRWHHHVDYRPFRANRLVLQPGAVIPEGVNEYGMKVTATAKKVARRR